MKPDYSFIREENLTRYGTEVSHYGKTLLADLYSEVDHFVFELLQNTEDAYGRQSGQINGRVEFMLTDSHFECRHFGKAFDEADIRGVCGIADSTKGDVDLGKFGIGFKSVFSVTDRPQIHSGDASFEIVDYVMPHAVDPLPLEKGETLISLPLRDVGNSADQLLEGLRSQGAASLLFLRHIHTIVWTDPEGHESRLTRESEVVGDGVQRVSLVEEFDSQDSEETRWIIFSRDAKSEGGVIVGQSQLAFGLERDDDVERVRCLSLSPIYVVFPTAVESQLGFFIQAPFRTTPSRDNLLSGDSWNEQLFDDLSNLMVDALEWFKANGMLHSEVFEALPIDPEDVEKAPMTGPMHDALVSACESRELIPVEGGGHDNAESLRLGRSADLRDLLDPDQLADLVEAEGPTRWVSGDVTQDRLPRVRTFLMDLLDVEELTSEVAFREMKIDFLANQPDDWLRSLYEFLEGVPRLADEAMRKPILRIESGDMVAPFTGDIPNAVLPSGSESNEKTIRLETCNSDKSRAFLESLGLETRQLVDDAIEVLTQKYSEPRNELDLDEYARDLGLFVEAGQTDSRTKLNQLHAALEGAYWVRVREAGSVQPELELPEECYGPRESLIEIFGDVPGVRIVDWEFPDLVGREMEALLRASGVAMGLRVRGDYSRFDEAGFLEGLRATSEQPETTGYTDDIDDFQIVGLEEWLGAREQLNIDGRSVSAGALWKELVKLAGDRGSVFRGIYRWTNYGQYNAQFDSLFVEMLRSREWVPSSDGKYRRPDEVEFESTGFVPDPFLQEVITFKPSGLDHLAEQAGVDPEAIALIKRLDISADQLRELFGNEDEALPDPEEGENGYEEEEEGEGVEDLETPDPPRPGPEPTEPDGSGKAGRATNGGPREGGGPKPPDSPPGGSGPPPSGETAEARKFISYVAADQEEPPDPDELSHSKRLALEEKAIEFILELEPEWERTAKNNPGFDLHIPADDDSREERVCEVKAMKTTLNDRPVTLSHRQFQTAIEKGDSFWLYIVEQADSEEPHLITIRDPFGKARYLTFDQGWREASGVQNTEGH